MSANLRTIVALMRRGLNEILRVPAGAIPGVLAPTIFMIGLSAAFGKASALPNFTADDFRTFIVPVGMLQGAGFTGAATGVNLARDIERGWFDRLMLAPAPRAVLLAGVVGSACLRCLLPATFLLVVAFALGVHWPGVPALAARRAAHHGPRGRRGVLRDGARAALSHPAGRAAHAGGAVRLDPLHDRLRRRATCCRTGSARSPTSTR